MEYLCDNCGEVITEEESHMFNGICEECQIERDDESDEIANEGETP